MGIFNVLAAGRKARRFAAAGALALAVTTAPAHAEGPVSGAEKLRRLDIMLMVTGLRCRTTASNFTEDYNRFTTSHMAELNRAAAQLRREMAMQYGAAGASRALDRLSTTMANGYGSGHPWLDCAQLKMVTSNLAQARGPAVLEAAADQLLVARAPAQFALAER